MKKLSIKEIKSVDAWLRQTDDQTPKVVKTIVARLLEWYRSLEPIIEIHQSVVDRLREMMGIKPKSERGSSLNQSGGSRKRR